MNIIKTPIQTLPTLVSLMPALQPPVTGSSKKLFDAMLAIIQKAGLPDYAREAVTQRLELIAERAIAICPPESARFRSVRPSIQTALGEIGAAIKNSKATGQITLPELPALLNAGYIGGKPAKKSLGKYAF